MNKGYIDIFPWNDSFKTGIDEIDLQHKKLVLLLNKVAMNIAFNETDIRLENVIDELLDYTIYHFDAENRYWLDNLPDCNITAHHKASHDQFIVKINSFKAVLENKPTKEFLNEMLSFLSRWLVSHILESDRQMAFLSQGMQQEMTFIQAEQWALDKMKGSAKQILDITLSAYKNLTENSIHLMHESIASRNALQKLHESENLQAQSMEYARIGYWTLSSDYQAEWSPLMFELFGAHFTQDPGEKLLFNIMNADYHQVYQAAIKHTFITGEELQIEYPITRSNDGEVRWIESRGKLSSDQKNDQQKITGFIQDITDRKENEQKITQLAYYDYLTLLPNRRLFFNRLDNALSAVNTTRSHHALLYIDIDDFKKVNDSLSHQYGDLLLKEVAARINTCIGEGGTVSRFGGDEFLIILSYLDVKRDGAVIQTQLIIDNIFNSLSEKFQLDEQSYMAHVSIGITLFNDDSLTALELIKEADIAMYQAKKKVHNSYCFFAATMQERLNYRSQLTLDINMALQNEQFELYYQPQVNEHEQVVAAEALIRWNHPKKGMLPPDQFIPFAEESAIIIGIGEWVLETACSQINVWQTKYPNQHLMLSVNVSYKQFCNGRFIPHIKALIENYHILPGRLQLELTETILVDDIELTVSNMHILQSLGIEISLDDFGTGYSSLQYLKRLPLSELKIDRSFISDLEFDVSDQSIVKTIISMSDALGFNVIAEGVEAYGQRNYLLERGCTKFQGYLYSKPLPVKYFEAYWLKSNSL